MFPIRLLPLHTDYSQDREVDKFDESLGRGRDVRSEGILSEGYQRICRAMTKYV
jgi:hypothetical protein